MTHTNIFTDPKRRFHKRVPSQKTQKFFARKMLANGLTGNLQIFEIKQLAEMEASYKARCRKSIKDYKKWRAGYDVETDMIELLYGNLEGIMLRTQAENMVQIYWVIRQDFRHAFKDYLARSCAYPFSNNRSIYSQSQAA